MTSEMVASASWQCPVCDSPGNVHQPKCFVKDLAGEAELQRDRIAHLEDALEEMKWAQVDALKRAEEPCAECGHIDWGEREVPSTYDTHE